MSWRRELPNWLLMAPALVLLVGVLALPLAVLVRMSLNSSAERPYEGALTIESYERFVGSELYGNVFLSTVKLTAVATVCCLLIGGPLAYLVWRSRGVRRGLLLAVVLLPLFTNVIARLYGWQILLAADGPVNWLAQWSGAVDEPLRLNYSFLAAAIGLTYVVAPYVTLVLFSAFEGLDWRVVEAARALGASRLRAMSSTVIPMIRGGLATAVGVSVAWGMGAYAETSILGSPAEWGLGYEAWRQQLQTRNWPLSAVVSIVMIVSTLLVIVLVSRALRGTRPLRGNSVGVLGRRRRAESALGEPGATPASVRDA